MPRHPRASAAERAAQRAIAELAPAGHARDEQLRRRAAQLDEQLDAAPEGGSVDLSAVPEDRDILRHYSQQEDGFAITDAQPGYEYSWAKEGGNGISDQVRIKQLIRVQMPDGWKKVWHVVQGDDPECNERDIRDVRGYRKIGDVILMRAKKEHYDQYLYELRRLNHMRIHGTSDGLEELARQSKGLIRTYSHAEMSDPMVLKKAMEAGMRGGQFTGKFRGGNRPAELV